MHGNLVLMRHGCLTSIILYSTIHLLMLALNCVPIGVMNHARNATAIRSEDEFFDLYGEESVDFSNDLTKLMGSRLKGAKYDLKLKFDEPFRILGERFLQNYLARFPKMDSINVCAAIR